MTDKLKILFLCTGNSCRSQMAEGFARHLRSQDIEAYSAGTAPSTVDPQAIKIMKEAGVDISGRRSKHVSEVTDVDFDYVVTLCDNARQSCPLFPGKAKVVHIGVEDPSSQGFEAPEHEKLAKYREVRDGIKEMVLAIPAVLEEHDAGLILDVEQP
ncbi:MAG: arsenate reductase ArsC [bacterium]